MRQKEGQGEREDCGHVTGEARGLQVAVHGREEPTAVDFGLLSTTVAGFVRLEVAG